jgi:putative lipoic acid-binding regulatory protein|tara:strand:- start:1789 stop:2082 length:294 start_codon:yes stop_codon:yes gene_type:complete
LIQSHDHSEDFYSRFYEQLEASQTWPGIYFFKFIVKSESPHLESLKSFFDPQKAVFSEKKSSKNTFTSLSIKIEMHSPEQVIEIYKKSSKLEGIIAL